MKRLLLVFALILASPALAHDGSVLTLSGRGEVATPPDMATIRLGVVTENAVAATAVAENSAQVSDILATLAAVGIAERDVQTAEFSVNPIWSSPPRNGVPENWRPEILGFSVTNDLSVRVRDLGGLGGVLDTVVRDGANQFRGLTFGLNEPGPALADARRAAVADAQAKATLYSEAAGFDIVGIRSFSEESFGGDPRPEMMAISAFRDASVPIAGGEVTIGVTVTIVYEIID